jgi:hypothetical protein
MWLIELHSLISAVEWWALLLHTLDISGSYFDLQTGYPH